MANKPNPATPHKIFRAASELFAKNSYEAVSVKDIAEAGNINSALISYYFGGKAKLYQAVLLKQADIFLNTIAKISRLQLSPLEKMYNVRASGNPSSWAGPIWINVNYLVFRGLLQYGYEKEAREVAEKTILLLGRDFERFGALHEYYLPDNGEPVLNRGFQNWNFLVLNMIAWMEGRPVVTEF